MAKFPISSLLPYLDSPPGNSCSRHDLYGITIADTSITGTARHRPYSKPEHTLDLLEIWCGGA